VIQPSPSYILTHLGEDDAADAAVSPPIYQTSNFCFGSFAEFRAALADEGHHRLYTRGNNPTVTLAEEKLAALEHGERAKLVGSGVAAISHSIMAFVRSGDHVVCVDDAYSWTRTLLGGYLPRFGVETSFVDGADRAGLEQAIRPTTKVIYLESPTSFTFRLQDLAAVAGIAAARGIRTIVDNTWATPIFCNPIDFGVDLVVHSASKYLGGHSDLVAGVIVGSAADIDRIQQQEFMQLGTVADPFMAWLLLRGMRTLQPRMAAHRTGALAVARHLEAHPAVESVLYPMLESHPDHELALRQMRGGSGLLSFRLKGGDIGKVERLTDALRLFKRAVSWGGYESLVFPYAAGRAASADRVGLVRLHVGLEDSDELIVDLDRALAAAR